MTVGAGVQDAWGLALTAAGPEAARAYDATINAYLAFSRDTGSALRNLFAADPDMPLAHVLRGAFMNLMGQPALLPKARESLAAAEARAQRCNARERLHIEALSAWCAGELEQATRHWEAILLAHPHDVAALKLASFVYFYLGDAASVRDSVARVLPAWDASMPGYSYLLGMHAFGLEECGDYAAAERRGREALALEPNDPWAVHAVAHVMEMQDRCEEGIAWIGSHEPQWARCNNFRYHIAWHRALMHLGLERYDEALALYDATVFDPESDEYLDLCNDIALLQRLEMAGVDVGDRWQQLADKVRRQRDTRVLAFIDAHYVLATAAVEGRAAAEAMTADLRRYAAAATGTTARVTADVGAPLADALVAYRAGDHAHCVARLDPIRRSLVRLGGSHAQRDLFAQVLIDAAMRSGQTALACWLLRERLALRPANRWGRARLARLGAPDAARAPAAVVADETQRLRQIMDGLQRVQAQLRASEERYRYLFEALPVPAYMYDLDTLRFLAVNDAASAYYGYSREEFLALDLTAIRPREDVPQLYERVAEVAQAAPGFKRTMQFRHRRKDGALLHVELHIHRVDLEGRRAAIVSVLDVSERYRGEQEAAARERRLRAQNLGMAVLSRSDRLEREGLEAALQEVVAAAAMALDAARVGVWLFDDERVRLVCRLAYERGRGFAPDAPITAAHHPEYFRAVDSDRILSIADARASPLTASMTGYLAGHGIGAMLDAPVVRLGRRVGVLCIEHCGGARTWHPDEETFAMLAADFVGIVLEADGRLAAQRALKDYSERLAALSRRLLVAQEAERRAVARELHDEIGQALTAVKLHLNVAARAGGSEAATRALEEAVAVANTAIAQVRDKALDLRPSMLDDAGLVPALRWYLERFEQRSGIPVKLTAAIGDRLPAPEQETVCFRVVQEALTNVARHARARSVRVTLARAAGGIELCVSDDGQGFDVAHALERAGRGEALGLAGMQERVALVGGAMEIESAPGQGCEIRVLVPLEVRA